MFKVFGEPEEVKKEVYLKLVETTGLGQEVSLVLVDKAGERIEGGILLDFYSDGTFGRRLAAYPDFGIKLDENRRIVERK